MKKYPRLSQSRGYFLNRFQPILGEILYYVE